MVWMADTAPRRASPAGLWAEVRSVVILGINYGTREDLLDLLSDTDKGIIALYARRRDYHEVIKGRLKELAGLIAAQGGDVKVFVDTAPVLEKTLAEAAGLGWQGKNTVLISREYGTWLLLGAIYTTLDLPASIAGTDSCGRCTRCLDICPTRAFPAPYILDSRRCISYLTIEYKGLIPEAFRAPIGNRIFGCDDCLAVCPWNKFARECHDGKLAAIGALGDLQLADLAGLDDAGFRSRFAGTPIKRTGRAAFVRNVLIALGNLGDAGNLPMVERLLSDPAPEVRGTAVWAIGRIAPARVSSLVADWLPAERDPAVRQEWQRAAGLPDQEL
jgi:epoxyqueuosine reductase